MRENEERKARPGFLSRITNKITLWFASIGSARDLPDPDTKDYVDLEDVDFSNAELMVIPSNTTSYAQYSYSKPL